MNFEYSRARNRVEVDGEEFIADELRGCCEDLLNGRGCDFSISGWSMEKAQAVLKRLVAHRVKRSDP